MCRWKDALRATLEAAGPILEVGGSTRLCVVGSAATALHGIDLSPGDLDFLAREPSDVEAFATSMARFALKERSDEKGLMNERWLSSIEEPFLSEPPNPDKFVWHFGRWLVSGFKVEVAHIAPPKGWTRAADGGLWECGPDAWNHLKRVAFDGGSVPAVPLELQLQTNMARGLEDRVAKIVGDFARKGYDEDILATCLSGESITKFRAMLTSLGSGSASPTQR
jgi:hypothetical protein